MRRSIMLAMASLFIIVLFVTELFAEDVQEPAVAGYFYPADPTAVKDMVDGYIAAADPEYIDGEIVAVIAPHAGYQYSGKTAGYAFKSIKDRPLKTAVVVAPSHRVGFKGLSVLDRGSYRTPLGIVPIERDITKQLIAFDKRIAYYAPAFLQEHAAEVEIPFLQRSLKDFKVVVILTGLPSYDTCTLIRDALSKVLKDREDVIIVSSTDMSHHYPDKQARQIDGGTLAEIKQFDPESLFLKLANMSNQDSPCGTTGMVGVMMAARNLGADKITILDYTTSADATGLKSSVVGYFSAAIYRSSGIDEDVQTKKENDMDGLLNKEQKERLLEIARTTMETYIREGKTLEFEEADTVLNEELGAFVTIHKKGQLRGCIGNMVGKGPLYLTIRNMTIASSTQDHRFRPVKEDELKDIDVEISVLSPMKKIDNPDEIVVGRHGVMVQSGIAGGVYLPQVADETGWSKEEFMNSLCAHKAGMPADSWETGKCDIYIFTAEVFGEKELAKEK